jgi:hypothetical protein
MRRTAVIAAVMMAVSVGIHVSAQPAAQAPPQVPITRILAIGTINEGVDLVAARQVLPSEVRETVALYLDGKIDQWFSLQGRSGVVFILNVTDVNEARAMLEKLPLGRAHMMSFELMPLAPLAPLRQLQGASGPPHAPKR